MEDIKREDSSLASLYMSCVEEKSVLVGMNKCRKFKEGLHKLVMYKKNVNVKNYAVMPELDSKSCKSLGQERMA